MTLTMSIGRNSKRLAAGLRPKAPRRLYNALIRRQAPQTSSTVCPIGTPVIEPGDYGSFPQYGINGGFECPENLQGWTSTVLSGSVVTEIVQNTVLEGLQAVRFTPSADTSIIRKVSFSTSLSYDARSSTCVSNWDLRVGNPSVAFAALTAPTITYTYTRTGGSDGQQKRAPDQTITADVLLCGQSDSSPCSTSGSGGTQWQTYSTRSRVAGAGTLGFNIEVTWPEGQPAVPVLLDWVKWFGGNCQK